LVGRLAQLSVYVRIGLCLERIWFCLVPFRVAVAVVDNMEAFTSRIDRPLRYQNMRKLTWILIHER
jgi:hypothetical protein